MPDDRNGAPPGPPRPFGWAAGTNGVHPPDGARRGPVHLPTRPLSVDVAEGPLDLVSVQADDELVNALGGGAPVTFGDRGHGPYADPRRSRDDRLVAMLAAWRAEIEAEPIPELVDLDTAVAAVVAGMKADAAGARRRRSNRLRHLAPLAAAAAIVVATVSGVGLGSQNAVPGDTLWPIQKVVNPERAESVEAKVEVEGRLQKVRTALANGDTATAASELQAIRDQIPVVRSEEGHPQLVQEEEFLTAKLADTAPGEPVDLSTPPKSKPTARSTAAAAPPPPPVATDPSQSAKPGDPSVSEPAGPDPRSSATNKPLAPAPPAEPGSAGPSAPDSGSADPDVTTQPDPSEPAPENTEGSSDPTAPSPPSADQPASEGAPSGTTSGQDEPTSTDTTASGPTVSGSAGTKVDATGTTTTS